MSKIHFTLTTWFNVLLIVVCALVVGALLSIAHPRPLLLSTLGAGAGLVAGILQRKSVVSSPAIFAEARSYARFMFVRDIVAFGAIGAVRRSPPTPR